MSLTVGQKNSGNVPNDAIMAPTDDAVKKAPGAAKEGATPPADAAR